MVFALLPLKDPTEDRDSPVALAKHARREAACTPDAGPGARRPTNTKLIRAVAAAIDTVTSVLSKRHSQDAGPDAYTKYPYAVSHAADRLECRSVRRGIRNRGLLCSGIRGTEDDVAVNTGEYLFF
jgi:hypothetical protein